MHVLCANIFGANVLESRFKIDVVIMIICSIVIIFLFSGHEPIYFIENKEKTLRASYDRGTQIFDYME